MDNEIVKTDPTKHGLNLPIGIPSSGQLRGDFSLKNLNFDREKAIGVFKGENESKPNTVVVSKTIAILLDSLCGKPFNHNPEDSKEKEEEALAEIGKMYLADVYYIYLSARLAELGPDYYFGYECPRCGCTGRVKSDISTMDVNIITDPSLLRKNVPLQWGFLYRDGSLKKSVTVQPMLWMHMVGDEMQESSGNDILMQLHFLTHCIVGVEGVEESIVLTPSELGTLRKVDINRITNVINNINIGPSLIANGKCPKKGCGHKFIWPIDWDYDSFFGTSSLSTLTES
jgi:hypothetical protein